MKPDALYITCSYNIFVENYIKANITKDSESINFCLNVLQDNFKLLNNLFQKRLFKNNIILSTLITLLRKDNKPKASIDWKINQYKAYLFNNSISFIDHLNEAFLIHINKPKVVYKNYPKSYKLFFFISKEIKTNLFKIIRRICQRAKRDYYTNSSYFNTPKYNEQVCFDLKLLETTQKENPLLFSFYLLSVSTSFNSKKIKDALNLNNPQYKKLKEDLCQLIKQLLLTS